MDLDAPVQYVKGVGPRRAEQLSKLGVQTVGHLLRHLPRRHEDRSRLKPIRLVAHGAAETVSGSVTGAATERRRGLMITRVLLADESGSAQLVWFNQPHVQRRFPVGTRLVAHGKVERRYGAIQISSPECEVITGGDMVGMGRIVPVYPLTEGLSQPAVRNAIFSLLPHLRGLPDTLPAAVRERHALVDLAEALAGIHFPESWEARDAALRRLVFEEFFRLQLRLAARKTAEEARSGIAFHADVADEIAAMLPFTLTGAQARVLAEIQADMRAPRPMHRLLQGDVGSGKTAVAAAAALAAIRSGFQVGLMAPTETLAEQHFLTLQRLFAARGVAVDLLTGSLAERERQAARERLSAGETALVIGTHALIQEGVAFRRLGLVIVDEQHRFGVVQRQSLREKGFGHGAAPDLLVMTATPIPRTLALTLYGDLDLSVIDALPPGRQPVVTQWFAADERDIVCEFLRDQVREGRQAYYVCPLIEESEALYAQSAVEKAEELRQVFPRFRVGLLHGRMRTPDRAATMAAFRAGAVDVLVCTTVIEVGVDVPNATVMVIEDADRFGLAQLHQLRGRVGRGGHRSYCLLVTDPRHNPFAPAAEGQGAGDGQRRTKVMVETTDGFRIAEEDLQIRGPGEVYGTRQHGFDALGGLRIANVLRDARELEEARSAAFALVAADPGLARAEHAGLRRALESPVPGEFTAVG
ncbi:MAG: ATP-dependent DNA helicase RecG [Armatimonadetes bacterium]|nr:ATP-dependent DNA helicase RecG [Armatimonadota bacterium]